MLLKAYNALQTKLNDIPNIKHLDWFNDQYAGTIHAAPGIFIEFKDPLIMETLSKGVQQAPFSTTIHVYSKVVPQQDKSLDLVKIAEHFEIVQEVYSRLHGFRANDGDNLLFNSLSRKAYQHHQYMQGWFVTTQDFESIIYDIAETTVAPSPKPTVIIE